MLNFWRAKKIKILVNFVKEKNTITVITRKL